MVTVDKMQAGLRQYVDTEMLPKMTGAQRWIMATAAGICIERLPQLMQQAAELPMVRPLKIITDQGIDVETAYKFLSPAAKAGAATFQIPLLGALTFSEADVDRLYQYIIQ